MKTIIGAVAALVATSAFARAEPQLELQQTVFSYDKDTVSSDDGYQTMPSDLEISATVGKWIFTVMPTQPGEAFEVAYEITRNLELGFDLGANKVVEDIEGGSVTTQGYRIGPHGQYSLEMTDSAVEFEFRLGLEKATTETELEATSTTAASTSESNETTYESELAVMYERVINDNLRIASGVGYTYGKTKASGDEDTTSTGELEVILLQFRYGFY